MVLTSTEPPTLLDARKDPSKPTKIATGASPGFTHANLWPHDMDDDWILFGGEGSGPDCTNDANSSFFTLDARNWQADRRFELVSEFKMTTGIVVDGAMPDSTYCVHWFDAHPSYVNGGLVAISWYEHGTRFLQVGTDGKIGEIGYFLPAGGQASAVYWVTPEIAYIADYTRGLDVVKFTGPVPQGRPHSTTPVSPGSTGSGQTPSTTGPAPLTPSSPGVSFSDLVALPSSKRCAKVKTFKVKARKFKDPVVSLIVSINGKKAATGKGSKLRKGVKLRKLPKRKKFTLQVQVKTKSGFQTAGQRSYRGC
jgi:hypothetical protein